MKNQKYNEEFDFSDPQKDFEDLKISNALARFDELLGKHTAENAGYSSKQIASFLFVRAYCETFTYRHRGKIKTYIATDVRSGMISIYLPVLFFSQKDYEDLNIIIPHVETLAIFPHNQGICIKTGVNLCPDTESPLSIATGGYFSSLDEMDKN